MGVNSNGKGGKIIDLNGRGLGSVDAQDDITLEPGVIIIHCILSPSTGRCQMQRDPRNPPPKNNTEVRAEMDNWLATLMYCLAVLMVNCVRDFGVPKDKIFETLDRTIHGYFDRGMETAERTAKVVINSAESSTQNTTQPKSEPQPTVKINWDAEIKALGFNQLNDKTYIEYCTQTGLSDRDKSKTPIAVEFYNHIVFRKPLDMEGTYLEIGREKELTPNPLDKKASKYLVTMAHEKPEFISKHYWQITEPEKTVELLKLIELEANLIAQILFKEPTALA